jgi:hypothetical protein
MAGSDGDGFHSPIRNAH